MSHPYQLTLTINQTGENTSLSGILEDDEWNLLHEFLQCVDELLTTKDVKDGMPASLKINWDKDTELAVATKLPDWEDVMAFLHRFRPIILKDENSNFYKVCNILGKKLDHSYFRNLIQDQRDAYSGKKMQTMIRVWSDDVLLNSEEVLQDWLNSFEYHRDKEKRTFIESLHAMLPLDASKVIFLSLLSYKMQATVNIAALVRVVVGKQKSLEAMVKVSEQ